MPPRLRSIKGRDKTRAEERLGIAEKALRAIADIDYDEAVEVECDHPYHVTHFTQNDGLARCPECFNEWWATDGSQPDDSRYTIDAIVHKALHDMDDL